MKKLFLTILIISLTISSASAKTYYFKDLKGIVESTATGPFDSSGGETSLDVSISFNKSSLYTNPDTSVSTSYSLTGNDIASVTLSMSSSNETLIASNDIILDTDNKTVTIPSSAISTTGEANITLIAKDSSDNTVKSATLKLTITSLSSDNILTKWTVTAGQTVSFPFYSSYSNTYTGHIDWGDGNIDTFTSVTIQSLSHTYNNAGAYNIRIDGDFANINNLDNMFRQVTIPSGLDISNWNLSNIESMTNTFYKTIIPTSLGIEKWDVSNVKIFQSTFNAATLPENFNLSDWNTSAATSLYYIFCDAHINGLNLSGWDLSNVTTFRNMFYRTSLSGDITYNTPVSESVYARLVQILTNGDSIFPNSSSGQKLYVGDNSCGSSSTCIAQENGIANKGWTIVKNQEINEARAFKTKWTVAAGGTAYFPIAYGHASLVNWGDNSITSGSELVNLYTITHTYENAGTYTILTSSRIGTSWSGFFQSKTLPAGFDISGWDPSETTSLQSLFAGATLPDGFNFSTWDVSKVTTSTNMFASATMLGSLRYDTTVSESLYTAFMKLLATSATALPAGGGKALYVGDNSCGSNTTCSSYENTITNKGWVITRTTAE